MNTTLRKLTVVPALAIVASLGACDDGVNEPQTGPIGQFDATEAVFIDAADANTTFDLIGEGGTLDMNLRSDGTFTSNLAVPGQDPVVTNGTFTRSGSQMAFTSGGVTNTMDFTHDPAADALTLNGTTADFDFGAGAVPARLDARFMAR